MNIANYQYNEPTHTADIIADFRYTTGCGLLLSPHEMGSSHGRDYFLLACITDWLDGYLARRFQITTSLGAFLDPIADKLLVAVVLVIVVGEGLIFGIAIPAAVIVGREVAISGLREWMAEMGKRTSVAVTFVAKIKTALQMLALILLLWYSPLGPKWVLWLGTGFLWVAAGLTLWSMVVYIKLSWPDFKQSARQN